MAAADGGWDGTAGASYYYDGDGRRVKKVSVSETTVFVYDALGRVAAEYSNQVQYKGTRYLTQDHLGSTRVVSDAQGNAHTDPGGAATGSRHDYFPFGEELYAGTGGRTTGQGYGAADNVRQKFTGGLTRLTMASAPVNGQLVLARQDYLPFGEEVPGTVGPRASVAGYSQATGPRQKYAGMEQDEYTGMSHTLWREFDLMSARWTTPDPYGGSMEPGSPQSFNRYTYVNNDPVNKVDPTGLMLSDIGVYQTDNASVVPRLNWAMVTVLHRYMLGLTGEAQRQQR